MGTNDLFPFKIIGQVSSIMNVSKSGVFHTTSSTSDVPSSGNKYGVGVCFTPSSSIKMFIWANNNQVFMKSIYDANDSGWMQLK